MGIIVIVLCVFGGFILLGLVTLVGMYNSLVTKRNWVNNTFAGIDVQLKRRYDLIPNLVNAVRGYMQHESQVLDRLAYLRSVPYGQMDETMKMDLDRSMQHIMNGLRVTVENYPDLKASQNMIHLQRTLNETEEQLAAARRSFNSAVMNYNNAVQTFPTNIFASLFGFNSRNFFEASYDERQNVNVNF